MRKIIKSSNTEQANTFRLHYFPNIPVSEEGGGAERNGGGGSMRNGSGFERQRKDDGAQSPQAGDPGTQLSPEEIERQAYEKGFAAGEHDGRTAAQQQTAPMKDALENTLTELDGLRKRLRQQIEQEVVELALHVARKVVRHELAVSKDAILCVVKEAMGHLEDPGKIAIRLNPGDLKQIQVASGRLRAAMENLDDIRFEEDPGIECGGCYIQTEFGEIDARVEEQLHAVEEAFRSEMRSPYTEQDHPEDT